MPLFVPSLAGLGTHRVKLASIFGSPVVAGRLPNSYVTAAGPFKDPSLNQKVLQKLFMSLSHPFEVLYHYELLRFLGEISDSYALKSNKKGNKIVGAEDFAASTWALTGSGGG